MNKRDSHAIPDVQGSEDTRKIAIDKVGIKAIRHPVKVMDKNGGVQHTIFKTGWDGWLDNTKVFTVPKDNIFVMGDNRDDSLDSRAAQNMGGVGFVPVENLMARAEATIGSYDFLNAKGPASWPGLVRWERFFKGI